MKALDRLTFPPFAITPSARSMNFLTAFSVGFVPSSNSYTPHKHTPSASQGAKTSRGIATDHLIDPNPPAIENNPRIIKLVVQSHDRHHPIRFEPVLHILRGFTDFRGGGGEPGEGLGFVGGGEGDEGSDCECQGGEKASAWLIRRDWI